MAGLLDFLQSASNSAASNVSAPVDGIAWLLRKAGLDVGEPVGGSDWMQRQGLTRPVKQGAASLAGETAGLLSPMLAAAKAPQIARGLLDTADDFQRYNQALGPAGVSHAAPWQGGVAPPRASGMTVQQAEKIIQNEDYLPWQQVAEAKKLLGIKEESAADIWAAMLAAKKAK